VFSLGLELSVDRKLISFLKPQAGGPLSSSKSLKCKIKQYRIIPHTLWFWPRQIETPAVPVIALNLFKDSS
jgi:hypothetical protein